MIGCIQALEVLKIAGGMGGAGSVLSQRLLLFDGESTRFRTVALRARQKECAVCGEQPTVTVQSLGVSSSYAQFCRSAMHDKTAAAIGLCVRLFARSPLLCPHPLCFVAV